ncbi:MAG: ABC transporter substrate-binding protein [Gemmataceae bacterium]
MRGPLALKWTSFCLILIHFLLLGGLGLLSGCGGSSSSPPILIAYLSQSGDDHATWEQQRQGVILAVEEANQGTDKVGQREVVALVPEPVPQEDMLQAEAVRLLAVNKVAALLGGENVAATERLAKIAPTYNVPVLTTASLPAPAIQPYTFTLDVCPPDQGRALATFAREDAQARRVAVLVEHQERWGRALAEAFIQALSAHDGLEVRRWNLSAPDDVTEIIPPLVSWQPDTVLLAGKDECLSVIHALTNPMSEKPLREPVAFLLGGLATRRVAPLATSLSGLEIPHSLYQATVFTPRADMDTIQTFTRTYEQRFGQFPDAPAALAYDSVRLLLTTMRQAGTTDGPAIRRALAQTRDFPSLTGPLSIGANHWTHRPVFILHWRKGETKVVRRFEGSK